jgi:hypothetical protein
MSESLHAFFAKRLADAAKALAGNGFSVSVAGNPQAARELALAEARALPPGASVSFGGSKTLHDLGIVEAVRGLSGIALLDTFEKSLPEAEKHERRRKALLSDLFLLGANAVTLQGALVNLDMWGNRVGGLVFGPRRVVVVAGRNKLVADVPAAMRRIKELAAPANAMRLKKKTPCAKTGRCRDCDSPERICNVWTITEKCFPRERIAVVLVNADLGL